MNVIDKFLKEYSYKFSKGYPDLNDPKDVIKIESLIEELIGETVSIKEANLAGRTTNWSQPTGAFYKYVELNDSSDTMNFETERDAPIFDIDSFEIIDNISKGETFKILDNKESDLTNILNVSPLLNLPEEERAIVAVARLLRYGAPEAAESADVDAEGGGEDVDVDVEDDVSVEI
jgi:hypothetical protein